MAKTSQRSKKKNDSAKVVQPEPWFEEYQEMGTLKLFPVNDTYLERIGNEFAQWCIESREKKLARYSLEEFLCLKEVDARTFGRWRERNEYLNRKVEYGLMVLGTRMEGKLFETSDKAVMYALHTYIPRWQQMDTYHANLKNAQNSFAALFGGEGFNVPTPSVSSKNEKQ